MRTEQIITTLKNHLISQMDKHRMNVEIMIDNPMAIHDHTAWTEGVESELGKMAEYHDKLEMISKFVSYESEKGHVNQKTKYSIFNGDSTLK